MPFNQVDSDTGETTYGLTVYDSEELLEILNANVVSNLQASLGDDTTIDTGDQTAIGRLNQVIADRLATIWAQAKLVEESMYVETSTGVSLSKLALLVGFLRYPASSSIGQLRFYGEEGTTIPADSLFASTRGDQFTNTEAYEITVSSCLSFKVEVGVLKDEREYSIEIDDVEFEYVSGTSETEAGVLQGLEAVINAGSDLVTATYDDSDPDNLYLLIDKDDKTEPMECEVSPLLTPYYIEIEEQVEASETGVVFGDADTITTISTPINGLDAINNPFDFVIGRVVETNTELQERIQSDYNSVGSGTLATITSALEDVESVDSVVVEENRTFETNANGIPAKAFECIIYSVEPNNEDIAQVIWNLKPAGIEAHGTNSYTVEDVNGVEHSISFSPIDNPLFAHIRVQYTLLDETEGEVYPEDGDLLIQEVVAEEGQSYGISQDVIGKRFYTPIFDNLDGIATLDVKVHLNSTAIEDLSTIAEGDWVAIEEVGRLEIATFAASRVLVEDVTT